MTVGAHLRVRALREHTGRPRQVMLRYTKEHVRLKIIP